MGTAAAGLALCALLALPATGQQINPEEQAVRLYLLSQAQREQYERLADAAERAQFIEAFWAEVDETPETAYNELREDFLLRLETANLYYDLPDKPGWRTDRGKVYIFFGPPGAIHRSRFASSGTGKYEVWVYSEPGDRERQVRLVFEDALDSGDFSLLTEVEFPAGFTLERRLPRVRDEGQAQ